jgi:hypothetical protein
VDVESVTVKVDSAERKTLVLEGSPLTALAQLNGKNYRKMLKTIAEHGAGNVAVVLQGVLRPPAAQGGAYVLEGAGFQVNVKTPTPGPI